MDEDFSNFFKNFFNFSSQKLFVPFRANHKLFSPSRFFIFAFTIFENHWAENGYYIELQIFNDIFYIYVFEYETFEILDNGADYKLEELLEMYKKEAE